jgi:hypothetical protein
VQQQQPWGVCQSRRFFALFSTNIEIFPGFVLGWAIMLEEAAPGLTHNPWVRLEQLRDGMQSGQSVFGGEV